MGEALPRADWCIPTSATKVDQVGRRAHHLGKIDVQGAHIWLSLWVFGAGGDGIAHFRTIFSDACSPGDKKITLGNIWLWPSVGRSGYRRHRPTGECGAPYACEAGTGRMKIASAARPVAANIAHQVTSVVGRLVTGGRGKRMPGGNFDAGIVLQVSRK